jgi:GGDEF domain-containing protein
MKSETATGSPSRCPQLVVVEGQGVGRVFPLVNRTLTIGRDPAGDIVLPHATVSWHHAAITSHRDQVVAEDLGSRNGTYVGVDRIVRRALAAGDVIAIGDRAALKLTFAAATPGALAGGATARAPGLTPVVANAAALVDRLRKERSETREPDVLVVLMFVALTTLPDVATPGPPAEELMRGLASACCQQLPGGELLARVSERELIVLLRSPVERAVEAGERIRAAVSRQLARAGADAAAAPTVVLVPVPFHATLGVESLLLLASRKAAHVLREAPGTVRMVSLEESLH